MGRRIALDVAPLQGDPAKMRAVAEQLLCPLCGRGPFRRLANHTVAAHDVSSRDLCDLLDVPYHVHFVAEDSREGARERAIDMGLAGMRKPGPGRKREVSKAGARIMQEVRSRNGQSFPPEHFRAMAAISNDPEARQRASETRRARLPEVAHGTITSYTRGCRCEACKDAQNAHQRLMMAGRRKLVRCEVCGREFETRKYSTATRCRQCPHNKVLEPRHGTGVMYQKRGCRCDVCRAWRSEQGRKERAMREHLAVKP